MKFVLFFILFAAGAAHAGTDQFGVGALNRICNIGNNLYKEARAAYTETCKTQMHNLNCDEFFLENEVPIDYRRNCDADPTMQFAAEFAEGWLRDCPQGAWRGVWDDDLITGGIEAVWDKLEKNGQVVAQPSPLATKHERAEKYRQAVRDQVDYLSLPYAEKRRLYDEAEAVRQRWDVSQTVIDNALDRAGVAIACYNERKRMELSCYGVAVAVATVGTFKVGKMAISGAAKGFHFLRDRGIQKMLYKAAGFLKGAPKAADTVASAAAKVESKLGYKPPISPTREASSDFLSLEARHPQYTSTELAKISGELKDGGKTLANLDIKVLNDNNFKKGLSGLLLAEALARNPKIQKISTHLTQVNADEVVKALSKGLSCAEAIMASPSFKIRAQVGFTKFVGEPVCEKAKGVFYYVVEKAS